MESNKSVTDSAYPSEDGRTYSINHLNLGETAHDSDIDSKWLLAQHRKVHMANKNINSSTKREFNVLSNFYILMNGQNLKIVISQQS